MQTNFTVDRLIAREQIREIVHLYSRAIDRFDLDLMRSLFHPDATDNHGMVSGPVDDFFVALEESLGEGSPWHTTQHTIGNIMIDHIDDDTARSEAYFIAYQGREQDGERFDELVGGRYLDRFERREDLWKIADRLVVYDWSRIDPTTPSFFAIFGEENFTFGRKGKDDPIYQRT